MEGWRSIHIGTSIHVINYAGFFNNHQCPPSYCGWCLIRHGARLKTRPSGRYGRDAAHRRRTVHGVQQSQYSTASLLVAAPVRLAPYTHLILNGLRVEREGNRHASEHKGVATSRRRCSQIIMVVAKGRNCDGRGHQRGNRSPGILHRRWQSMRGGAINDLDRRCPV